MEILNLTPHTLVVLSEDHEGEIEGTTDETGPAVISRYRVVAEIPPSGTIARASQKEEVVGSIRINGVEIPVVRVTYCEPIGLPQPRLGTFLFVSAITAQAAQAYGRSVDDLIFPGKLVRDPKGRIIGIISFAQLQDADTRLSQPCWQNTGVLAKHRGVTPR